MSKKLVVLMLVILQVILYIVPGSAQIIIDTSQAQKGNINVFVDEPLEKKTKLSILKDGKRVNYDLVKSNEEIPFTLTFGSGRYEVRVLEQKQGNSYVQLKSKVFNVKLEDEQKIYLNSNIEVNWNYDQEVIKLAHELTKDLKTDKEKIEAIYQYVIQNYEYDFEKIKKLDSTYKPNLDKVYVEKKGICYDYSAIFAGMLRSVGIPAKLVKGYMVAMQDTYHAWNEVLIDGKWETIDTTNDSYKNRFNIHVDMYKNSNEYIKSVES